MSGGWAPGARAGDLDVWLGQRLHWRLGSAGPIRATALVDGRLRFDALGGPFVERAQVRALGVRLESDRVTIELGRSRVEAGGPRLVDGIQLRVHPTPAWDVGIWAGLAPDLFTTRPVVRPGGGPIVVLRRGSVQLSAVGEVLFYDGGLDRAALLAQGRVASEPGWDASGRLDVQLTDAEGQAGLADAAAMVRWRPLDALRLDVLANAYSSLRYLRSEQLDPTLRRFDARIDAMGLGEGLTQDKRDPRLFQLYGANARWSPGGATAPFVDLAGRVRWHDDPDLRFSRVGAGAGLLVGDGTVEVGLDGKLMTYAGVPQVDAGFTAGVFADRGLGIDTSIRVIVNSAYGDRLGWYGDVFVDARLSDPVDVMAGVAASAEPDLDYTDVGFTGFVRLAVRFRGALPGARGASGSGSPPP